MNHHHRRLSSNRNNINNNNNNNFNLNNNSNFNNNNQPRPPMIPISINSSSFLPKPISSNHSITSNSISNLNSSLTSTPPSSSSSIPPRSPINHSNQINPSSSNSIHHQSNQSIHFPPSNQTNLRLNHSSFTSNSRNLLHLPNLSHSQSNSSTKLTFDPSSSSNSQKFNQINLNSSSTRHPNTNILPPASTNHPLVPQLLHTATPSSSSSSSSLLPSQIQSSYIPTATFSSNIVKASISTANSASSLNSSLSSTYSCSSSTSPSSSPSKSFPQPNSFKYSNSSFASNRMTPTTTSVHPSHPSISTNSFNPSTNRLQSTSLRHNLSFQAYEPTTLSSSPPVSDSDYLPLSLRSHDSYSSSVTSSDKFSNGPSSPSRLSRNDSNISGLIDIDFGPSFSHQSVPIVSADSNAGSLPSTPHINHHSFHGSLANSLTSNSHGSESHSNSLSSSLFDSHSNRSTLLDQSSITDPSLDLNLFYPNSITPNLSLTHLLPQSTTSNGYPVTPPRSSNSSSKSLSNQFSHATLPLSLSSSSLSSLSDSSPPPSFELISEATPKHKSCSLSAPSLLDLDISGRGPSIAQTQLSPLLPEHDDRLSPMDHNQNYDHRTTELDLPSDGRHLSNNSVPTRYSNLSKYSSERPRSRQIVPSYENDLYYPSGLNDENDNDDTHSIQYTGSSCDDHRNPSQGSTSLRSSPYMKRERLSDSSSSTQPKLSSQKSFNIFKLGQSKSGAGLDLGSQVHPSSRTQDSQHMFKRQVDPSPVSSLTSFNTSGSKSSSTSSSSSRMARLLSRVTGHSGLSSLSVVSKRSPQVQPSNLSRKPPNPIARKASLSNLLDTITITRDKSKPASSPSTGQTNPQPSVAPRKSFDMLMRPFTGGKSRATQNHDPSNPKPITSSSSSPQLVTETSKNDPNLVAGPTSKPLLKAKRSFDLLRGKLANGKKSMDELSHAAYLPSRHLPAQHSNSSTGPSPSSDSASQMIPAPSQSSDRSRDLPNRPLPGSQSAPTLLNARMSKNTTDHDKHSHSKQSSQLSRPASQLSFNAQSDASHSVIPQENTQATSDQNIKPSSSHSEIVQAPEPIKDDPIIIDDQSIAEWNTLESILNNLQGQRNLAVNRPNAGSALNRNDLTVGLTHHLLPFLRAEECHHGSIYNDQAKGDFHRQILLGWLELIFDELQELQPASRAACLDGVSGILESHFFASRNINSNPATVKKYRSVLISVLHFAVDKLNDKAVYANTLVFAGRMLSLAFFRIEGVGRKLLRALPPVKRMSMRRLLDEMGSPESIHSSESPNMNPFPAYLRELCFVDLASYYHVFNSPSTESDNLLVQENDIQVEMNGNWLIRWTASDSDLPFAFYRAYHRQLATYLRPQQQDLIHPSTLISMPGFLFISASFLDKCDSLVHRSLRSVTTLGPTSNNFNAGESANLAMGAKPKVLELAHRRLVSTALDLIGGPPLIDGSVSPEENGKRRRQFFGGLLNLWIRAIAKRTNIWDTRSVFLLLDLLDAFFYTVLYTAPIAQAESNDESHLQMVPKLVERALELFDVKFILDITRRILLTADNTVCILRTIAFIYSQFEALTNSPETLKATCLDLLLDHQVFQHLFLHWNSGVRGYYMRLLVWRLSRLGGFPSVASGTPKVNNKPKSKEVIKILLTFNARLDAIRKRHDELSPESQFLTTEDDDRRRRRTTICSTRGVSDKPWAISELPAEEVCAEAADDVYRYSTSSDKPVAKVVSWLKVVKRLGGGSSKQKSHRQTFPTSESSLADHPHQQPAQLQQQSPPLPQQSGSQQPQQQQISEQARSLSPETPQGSRPLSQAHLSEIENDSNGRKSESSPRAMNAHAPDSPTFFQFEFELGAEIPRSDSFDTPLATTPTSASEPASPINSSGSLDGRNSKKVTDHSGPNGKGQNHSHDNSNNSGNNVQVSVEPRVSIRFSKRASLLPPAALNMLKDNNEEVPEVPSLPDQYKQKGQDQHKEAVQKRKKAEEELERKKLYDKSKHAYAIKALAEYEQSLEEEFEWNEKLLEEQHIINQNLQNQDSANNSHPPNSFTENTNTSTTLSNLEYIVPRLAVSWPLSFSDED